ncbi:unnamed protein product [Trifolium pratense]|uniref:Uncharacterized protein n=1 Tax=Trifolium pratense TaxID=57577 RepID=A0ACB0LXJ8_TRIPR|nr:unnamed protein product [Trifolium pratense]
METNTLSPSLLNKHRISTTIDRLTWHFQQGNRSDSVEFTKLCTILSRGIDFAIANCETPPPKANKLPFLIKQMNHRRKTEDVPSSLACVMVLCISVKNACKFGWFNMKDSEEILTIVDELGKMYCTMGNLHTGFRFSCHSTVLSEIMKRFYPNMKLGPIIVLNQVNPGYGASIVDFNITKNTFQPDKKIWLLVAQTDNIETSACLISPQEVNFLVNGQAIDKRSMCRMDHGPQMPTCLNSILKFGTNLVQAVGQFNGHYVVLVAYMSYNVVASLRPEHLPDYVQPVGGYSDSDIVEGESRISLNCPISFTRIKTPVKGCSCKHFQCFDFDNFVEINCKRPSWRCPHCNQYVCYTDIRLDRNMIEILEKVGDNVMEVIVHADGSLKEEVLMESDDMSHSYEKELQEYSTCSSDNVVDTCEIEDRKPFQASFPTKDDLRDGIDLPVLADPAFLNIKAEGHNQFLSSRHIHRTPTVIQTLPVQSQTRHIHRTPTVILALPVQSQTSVVGPHPHNSVTNIDSFITTSAASAYPHNAILSDAERQQLFFSIATECSSGLSSSNTGSLFINLVMCR